MHFSNKWKFWANLFAKELYWPILMIDPLAFTCNGLLVKPRGQSTAIDWVSSVPAKLKTVIGYAFWSVDIAFFRIVLYSLGSHRPMYESYRNRSIYFFFYENDLSFWNFTQLVIVSQQYSTLNMYNIANYELRLGHWEEIVWI